jgi:hypothetical protein
MELGHLQPLTPIQTDKSTAAGFANDTIKQKCSKAMDMCFYTGSKITNDKDNSSSIGYPASKTLAIITQNITPQVTIILCPPSSYYNQANTDAISVNALRGCTNSPPSACPAARRLAGPLNNQSIQSHPITAPRLNATTQTVS